MKIYKFQDLIDFESAFIIAQDLEKATELIRDQTSIPFELIDTRPLDDFPLAKEKWDGKISMIWINNILPF